MDQNKNRINRREFLRRIGIGTGSAFAFMALKPLNMIANDDRIKLEDIRMTYRIQHGSGKAVSLLGFGMMRLPDDQDEVNKLVDYAIEHGVNYFDTAPVYKGGRSEEMTGIALSRYPRDKYLVATKMSNQNPRMFPFEEAKKMYEQSFKKLQVDYIDYYLLHSVGGGGLDNLRSRFLDNGLLDFLMKEREAGRIRHLGFSYHGDVSVFDWLVDNNDQYHLDFVQIQMNFLDWRHASIRGGRRVDADAEYLYNKLEKAGIQCVIMEPLRGGALGKISDEQFQQLKDIRPDDSAARWAFRWVGTYPNVLTVLSGMNKMEHLEENVKTFSPLDPCTENEKATLASIADVIAGVPTIPCTTCAYCMPCPFDVDIPGNFAFYNEAVHEKILPLPDRNSADFAERKRKFFEGYRTHFPDEKAWAYSCQDCEACLPKCPQQIRIPNQLSRIVETLR